MIRHKIAVGGAVVLAAMLLAVISNASADEGYPEGLEVFQIPSGQTCVLYDQGKSLQCFCECPGGCDATTPLSPSSTPTEDRPDVEPTVVPSATPTAYEPTDTPRPTVEESPTPSATGSGPTDEPTATVKPHCDQGRGNGDDGCSPGNSDNNHDPNDPQRGPRD